MISTILFGLASLVVGFVLGYMCKHDREYNHGYSDGVHGGVRREQEAALAVHELGEKMRQDSRVIQDIEDRGRQV